MEAPEHDSGLDPIWNDLDWATGQLFFMGWEGTEVTPQIKSLIEDHHLGAILLTAKNLKTAQETARLVQELQNIAHNSGHPVPLLIALDQENGCVNSIFDEDYICQFPSAMGLAATNSLDLAYEVANATAKEIAAVGVNMIMGPVLDVLTNARYQPLGVRAAGDDAEEVSQYAIAAMNGYRQAGLVACGKHFPSYGNLDFLGASSLNMPLITETIEQLSLSALVPFRNSVREGIDAMMVGGCAMVNDTMNVMHACLSDQVVKNLLRKELGFNGVTISECLEMDALSQDIGVRGGTVMAVEAGCDLVLFCRSFSVQQEAISGLKLGIENDMISRERIMASLKRVLELKSKCTDWLRALNPPGISLLSKLHPGHLALSRRAYDCSITVVRDRDHNLRLLNTLYPEDEVLLLTPLVKPLPISASNRAPTDIPNTPIEHNVLHHRMPIMNGEGVFRELGRSLARQRHGKLLHTSYTANGLRPVHENLISRAAAIIIVTADANRNLYQNGFTKHVAMMCSMLSAGGKKRPLVVVSVSSPYDFALDSTIGTYICTFDFTDSAMNSLVRVLFSEFVPQGTLPGTLRKSQKVIKPKQNWLVEVWDRDRDFNGLDALIRTVERSDISKPHMALAGASASTFIMSNFTDTTEPIEDLHFVVRNSSTHALFGFCSTHFYPKSKLGIISSLFVDPSKRNLSIGHSLHRRALRGLLNKAGIKKLQIGGSLPSIFLGIPMSDMTEGERLKGWFSTNGWGNSSPRLLYTLILRNLNRWTPPEDLINNIQRLSFKFDLIYGSENTALVKEHVSKHAGPEILSLYQLALPNGDGIVRAKSPVDGSLVGTVIVTRPKSILATLIPALNTVDLGHSSTDRADYIGGIIAPVVLNSPQAAIILQGLVLLGIRQNKAHGKNTCLVNWVQGEDRDVLLGMGFDVLEAFEELSCDAKDIQKF
ncbi:hypothetical protein K3495_g11947 [Podosphaera aphanis]|nr:hypothetical protein K3495_g11947 [Podosphaera aphanis]